MEGYYTFVRPDGERFRAEVPRFELNGPIIIPNAIQTDDQSDNVQEMN